MNISFVRCGARRAPALAAAIIVAAWGAAPARAATVKDIIVRNDSTIQAKDLRIEFTEELAPTAANPRSPFKSNAIYTTPPPRGGQPTYRGKYTDQYRSVISNKVGWLTDPKTNGGAAITVAPGEPVSIRVKFDDKGGDVVADRTKTYFEDADGDRIDKNVKLTSINPEFRQNSLTGLCSISFSGENSNDGRFIFLDNIRVWSGLGASALDDPDQVMAEPESYYHPGTVMLDVGASRPVAAQLQDVFSAPFGSTAIVSCSVFISDTWDIERSYALGEMIFGDAVPTPGTAALALMAGTLAARRRRLPW